MSFTLAALLLILYGATLLWDRLFFGGLISKRNRTVPIIITGNVVQYDIANWERGVSVPEDVTHGATLHLTNSTGLTTMPAVKELPEQYTTVSCDAATCGDSITSIGCSFLCKSMGLVEVDLSSLTCVGEIDSFFLDGCTALTSINLCGFDGLRRVGAYFLDGCSQLAQLDLSAFRHVMSIGSSFLAGCSSLSSLDVSVANLEHVDDNFLCRCSGLQALNIQRSSATAAGSTNASATSHHRYLSSIGDSFLYGCAALTLVDLTALSEVASIGHNFLNGCSSLTAIDLGPLSHVRTIDGGFLAWCTGLKTLDLHPLSKVTTIVDEYFLIGCRDLRSSIDCTPIHHCVECHDSSCSESYSENVDLGHIKPIITGNVVQYDIANWELGVSVPEDIAPGATLHLTNSTGLTTMPAINELPEQYATVRCDAATCGDDIVAIEFSFLQQSQGLTSVDLSSLRCVAHIDDFLLDGCAALTHVDLSAFQDVITIGSFFLYSCSSLVVVDMASFQNLKSIEGHFLNGCTSLTQLHLGSALPHIDTIGESFLSGCTALPSIDLSAFGAGSLTKISNNFLYDCNSLKTVDFSPLHRVVEIGDDFLRWCNALESVDLRPFSNVTTIGEDFLCGCDGLLSIDVSPLTQLQRIDLGGFFKNYQQPDESQGVIYCGEDQAATSGGSGLLCVQNLMDRLVVIGGAEGA